MAQFTEAEKITVLKSLRDIDNSLNSLNIIVRGNKDSAEPLGLIHMVDKNTRFRKWVTAWLWLLMIITTGLVAERLFNLIGG